MARHETVIVTLPDWDAIRITRTESDDGTVKWDAAYSIPGDQSLEVEPED